MTYAYVAWSFVTNLKNLQLNVATWGAFYHWNVDMWQVPK
jgi:hypothetical protein